MIVYNGTQSNMLAGSRTGVLDNCFTVGWAGERRGSMEGRGEQAREKGRGAGAAELKTARERTGNGVT